MTIYTIDTNCGKEPNQIQGHTDDGREFYFRCDGDYWSLSFGQTVDEAIEKADDYSGFLFAAGWMETDQCEALFWDVIRNCVESGYDHPQMATKNFIEYQAQLKMFSAEMMKQSTCYQIPVDEVMKMIRKYFPELAWI